MAAARVNSPGMYLKEMVGALLTIIEARDPALRHTCERLAKTSLGFSKFLKLSSRESNQIYLACLLRDIGTINISSDILLKQKPLSEGEDAMLRMHPQISAQILSQVSFLQNVIPIISHHHESFDGSGYPDGLAGTDIPFGARVLNLLERYDRAANGNNTLSGGKDAAVQELTAAAGTALDPSLVKAFIQHLNSAVAAPATSPEETGDSGTDSIRDIINTIVERFQKNEINLPVLPRIITDIQRTIRNPTSTADAIAKLIERDAVISLRLITTANSPLYRGTEKIHTVRQAVPRLGLKQTQSIVNAIANKSLYKTDNEQFMEVMEKLWLHSLASAYAARGIASKKGLEDAERFFLLGLSHDIGKVFLLKAFDVVAGKSRNIATADVMRNIQEIHTDFGGALLERWKFPPDYARVARMHNDKNFFESTVEPVLIVNLSSAVARSAGYASTPASPDAESAEPDPATLQSAALLSLDAAAIEDIQSRVSQIMQECAHFF